MGTFMILESLDLTWLNPEVLLLGVKGMSIKQ